MKKPDRKGRCRNIYGFEKLLARTDVFRFDGLMTKKLYGVYYEILDDYVLAREREDRLKGWKREWKVDLVEGFNPAWTDLRWELEKKLAH